MKIKRIFVKIKEWLVKEDINHKKTNMITFFTMLGNLLWGIVKILFGVFVKDYFWCVSGVFTLDIGLSKIIYRVGRIKSNYDLTKEIPYYRNIGICLAAGSLMYICYMARLLIWDVPTINYDTILGITIAAFAFLDLGLAIRSFVISNKRHDFLLSGLRLVGISSGLTAIVLTQIALISLSNDGSINSNLYNGIFGVVAGVICLGISIFMIINSFIKINKII